MCHPYIKGYYLADGIYLKWHIIVKTRRDPKEEKYKRFANEYEACREEVNDYLVFCSLVASFVFAPYEAMVFLANMEDHDCLRDHAQHDH
jgi:hypothetical protein